MNDMIKCLRCGDEIKTLEEYERDHWHGEDTMEVEGDLVCDVPAFQGRVVLAEEEAP